MPYDFALFSTSIEEIYEKLKSRKGGLTPDEGKTGLSPTGQAASSLRARAKESSFFANNSKAR